jgi:16S rRNA (guanine527-N7)-methyltransferase
MTAASIRALLREEAQGQEITLSEKQLGQFSSYLQLIQQWQRSVVRLVGSDEPRTLVETHIADAFCIYRCMNRWKGSKLIDIGSGAGFPGVCLKIIEPGLHLTLVDASAKKTSFLAKVASDLALERVKVIRGRAEQLGHEAALREQFDLATMRAVADLPRAIELGLPFVSVGGHLIVATGTPSREDLEVARRIGRSLGAGEMTVHGGLLGEVPVRGSIVVLAKRDPTERDYLRGRRKMCGSP